MQRRICVFLLLTLLLPGVFAVWDPREVKFTEGYSESIGPFLVRLDEIDVMSKSAFVTVRENGEVIGQGPVRRGRPFILSNRIAVQLESFSKIYSYGNVAKTNVSLWVDGRIASWRFPTTMSLFDNIHYNAYIVVENNGAAEATYRTEIVQEGVYLPSKDKYQLEDGREVSRVLTIDLPMRTVRADRGDAMRVDYKEISANYRQHRGHYNPEPFAGVRLNLYYKNLLLDSVLIPKVKLTTTRSAGILDVLVPDTMAQDNAYEGVAQLMNGGYDDTSTQRSKFNLELRTKGFELQDTLMGGYGKGLRNDIADVVATDIIRGSLLRGEPQSWRFRITPHVAPGEYVITFVLAGREDGSGTNLGLDRVDIPVTITKGFLTRIERIEMPEEVMFGGKIPVRVTINNVGLGRIVLVRLASPVLETSTQKIVQLPGYQMTEVLFDTEALMPERVPFTVELLTHYAVGNKNFDPSGEDQYLLDSKKVSVGVRIPGGRTTSAPRPSNVTVAPVVPIVSEPAKEPLIAPPSDVLQPPFELPPLTPPASYPSAAESWMAGLAISQEYLPWILVAVALILLLLGVKIIWDAYHVEEIEEEVVPIEEHKAKKRKQ
ncbi:hypothetical protein HY641_03435 [Candidatus Woesearchaeota archaeon]|nr:hypothetical protein [Candidatus Woesearchaeota archaeon]